MLLGIVLLPKRSEILQQCAAIGISERSESCGDLCAKLKPSEVNRNLASASHNSTTRMRGYNSGAVVIPGRLISIRARGRLAQLVQSAALTRQRSKVRTLQRPRIIRSRPKACRDPQFGSYSRKALASQIGTLLSWFRAPPLQGGGRRFEPYSVHMIPDRMPTISNAVQRKDFSLPLPH